MLSHHPTLEDLQLVFGSASPTMKRKAAQEVVRHLLARCSVCISRLEELGWRWSVAARIAEERAIGAERERSAESERNYDGAFEGADRAVEELLTPLPFAESVAEFQTIEVGPTSARPPSVDELIERSQAARYSNPEEMLFLADVARSAAEATSRAEVKYAMRLADLRAKAWSQFGNALRVCGRLAESEEAFAKALAFREAGTGDPTLRARVLEQMVSLLTHQRRFDSAIELAREAEAIYRELGETASLASAMVQRAIAEIYAGDPSEAIKILTSAIPAIDPKGDPHLLLAACHNLVCSYIHLGEPDQAFEIYEAAQVLYREFSDPLILLRNAWSEGALLRDLGHLDSAEDCLLRARCGFLEKGLTYEAAAVSLDLAVIYLKLHRTQDLEETVVTTAPIFRALGVDREAIASLLQLQQLAHEEQRALELVRSVARQVEPFARRPSSGRS